MRRQALIAAAAGALGGLLLVAAWRGSVFGVTLGLMFSPLPLAMAVLGYGFAALPVAVLSGAVVVAALTGSAATAALYLAVDVLPVAILTRLGRVAERAQAEGRPAALGGVRLGVPVAILAIAAVAMMTAGLTGVPVGPDGLEATLRARLDEIAAQVPMAPEAEAMRGAVMAAMARILPGGAALNWALRALISTAIGQALLARDGKARWPTPAYRTIAVPGWSLALFAAAVATALVARGDASYVAGNAAAALSLPLALVGLAVVHVAIARLGFGRMALIVFYGVALMAAGPALAAVVLIGAMEQFLQMRSRLIPGTRDGGE